MKTKISRIGKSAISVILSILMIFTCLSYGMLDTIAAQIEDNSSTSATTVQLAYQANMPSSNYDASSKVTMTQSANDSNRYYTTLTLTANTSYGCFIKVGSNYYKVSTNASSDQAILLYDYGNTNYGNSNHRVTYTTGSATKYTFTFDTSNNHLIISPTSSTVNLKYGVASACSGWYDLPNSATMSGSGTTYTYDMDLTAQKYYFHIKSGSYVYKANDTLTIGTPVSLYSYGNSEGGGSDHQVSFTPSVAGKYRFTWNHADKTLSVKLATYSVTISAGTGGSVDKTSPQQIGATAVKVTATANPGYTFSSWTVTGGAKVSSSTSPSTNVTATAEGTVTANFTKTLYNLTDTTADKATGKVKFTKGSASGTEVTQYSIGDTIYVTAVPAERYTLNKLYLTKGSGETEFTSGNSYTVTASDLGKISARAVFTKADPTAKPKVILKGTELTEAQMEVGKDIKLTATVTPAKNSAGKNVTGEYTVDFYKGATKLGSNKVTVTDTSTTVISIYNTKLDELPATYTAKAYPTTDPTNISDASNEVKYIQKYPNKIYFDPSNDDVWRKDIQLESNEFPTVTMTINSSSLSPDEKTYKMYIDPGFQFANDKGVFLTKVSNKALEAMQQTSTKITFSMTTTAGSSLSMIAPGRSYIKDGSIMTMKYGSGSTKEYKWSNYNVSYEKTFPNKTITVDGVTKKIETYREFTQYLAQNKTMDVVYYDNSATQWHDVYLYSWAIKDGKNVFDTSTGKNISVAMKPLKNFDNIWYYELPAGQTVPDGNFLFKDRSDAYDGTGSVFGYDYQQSVDLVEGSIVRAQSATDEDMYFETLKFDHKYTLDAYDPTDASAPNLHNPIFITAQFASCTVRTQTPQTDGANAYSFYNGPATNFGESNKEIKNRAFAYGWSDLYANVVASAVKTKPVNVYFDIHDKVKQGDTSIKEMYLYHSVRNAYDYSGLPQFTKLFRLGSSTIFSATIQLPYNEDYSQLAFTFDSFKIGNNQYAMGADSQPDFRCINTGEVWYEIKSNIDTVGPMTNVSTRSKAKAVDSAAVGAQADSDSVGATGTFKLHIQLSSNEKVLFKSWNPEISIANWNNGTSESNGYYLFTKANIDFESFANSEGIQIQTDSIGFQQFKLSEHADIKSALRTGELWVTRSGDTWTFSATNPSGGTTPGVKEFTSVGLIGTINGRGDFNSESYELTYDPTSKTWSITLDFNGQTNNFKARANDDWTVSFGANSGDNYTTTLTGRYKISIADGADDKDNLIVEKVAAPTNPSITLNPSSTTITLNKGMVTLSLNPVIMNAPADTQITYSITPNDTSKARIDGDRFKAYAAGPYVVKASITVDGRTYSDTITITVNEPAPITEVCGILAYEHATAEFSSTTGGIIDSGANVPHVMLTNGYYKADSCKTGYTVIEDNKYVTIYGLADSVKTDASATFNASTSKADASSSYQLAGWKKNGLTMADFVKKYVMFDKFPAYSTTVSYLANWSEVTNIPWTFTYNWDRFDRSQGVWEFKWQADKGEWSRSADTVNNYITDSITITVNLPSNYTKEQIIEEYYSYAPTVDDDYFGYSFRNNGYTYDETNHSVSTDATMSQPKVYNASVTYNGAVAPLELSGYYQSALYLTDPTVVPDDKILVWVNDSTKNVLGTGDSLNIRITNRELIIHSELRDKATYEIKPYTTVSEPTYEAYYDTAKKENRVRMNFLVDNYTFGNNVTEYGVLYFFCAENGRPLDSSISQDYNISADKLIAAAQGKASGITRRPLKNPDTTVNAQGKYFYQPTLALTDANKKRYLRMFSYFKYTDDNGVEQIVISDPDSVVIGTLGKFTPVF